MNKNELEYERAILWSKSLDSTMKTIRLTIRAGAYLAGIWLTFDGLHKVIGNQGPAGIDAYARVIQALHLGSIMGYLWGVGATGAWVIERRGKQRMTREKSKLQKQLESADPNRTSSGLTEFGLTPKEAGE